jgi:metalloprotein, YbeY/UPF0054 family
MKTFDNAEDDRNIIIIENEQDKKPVDEQIENLIRKAVNESIKLSNIQFGCEISITLVDNDRIREINKQYRNIDAPTDVLSFPMLDMHEGVIISTEGDYDLDEDRLLLGDIVISLEKAEEQAQEYGHSYNREIAFLTTHGIFHLLGYDHMDYEQESKMMGKQEEVLTNIGLVRNEK